MEIALNRFEELSYDEAQAVDGGGVVAAVYALGFIMGMSPLGALIVCGVAIGAGIAVAVATH